MAAQYSVSLSGKLVAGFERDAVAAALAARFKMDIARAASLLAGKPTVVKSGVDEAAARQLVTLLTGLGAEATAAPAASAPAPAAGLVTGVPEPVPAVGWASDRSVFTLIAANLFAIVIALWFEMRLKDLMLVYWTQSVIIGVSFFVRMLALRRFSTRSGADRNPLMWEFYFRQSQVGKFLVGEYFQAFFFLIHYGFFHVLYFVFLTWETESRSSAAILDWGFALCVLAFLVNHAFSLAHNLKADRSGTPNISILFWLPYARILPMQLTLIFGSLATARLESLIEQLRVADLGIPLSDRIAAASGALLMFLALKTLADVVMHVIEHRMMRGAGRS